MSEFYNTVSFRSLISAAGDRRTGNLIFLRRPVFGQYHGYDAKPFKIQHICSVCQKSNLSRFKLHTNYLLYLHHNAHSCH